MKKQALLVIGDRKISLLRVNRSFVNFVEYARRLKGKRTNLQIIDYAQLFKGQLGRIDSSSVKVAFFFPYKYWNRHIEIYQDGRIYGDKSFGLKLDDFFKQVNRAIERALRGKRIEYLNPPRACYLDRDKKASKDLLRKNKIPLPQTFRAFCFQDIQRLLDKGLSLYIKPRFGALGKGITYVDREGVTSNFLFRNRQIVSRPYDYNWRFNRIKDERRFLNKLLKKDFICEEAILPATYRGKRFDFRVYVMFGRIVYLYAKSADAQAVVTNWSQGGKIDKKKKILKAIPKVKIEQVRSLAKRSARALGLNFAGVDIIFSRNLKNAYVLEANAFPGYEKGFDLMKCLLKFLVK